MHMCASGVGRSILIATLILAAPTYATEDLPRPATAVELFDHFADTTQIFTDGVAYYSGTGVLLVARGEDKSAGQWTTDDAGTLCWVMNDPDKSECAQFVTFQNLIYRTVDGHIRGQPDLQPGNLLAEAANAKAQSESAELFTPEQTRELVSGKTALRSEVGRMYYAPDQTLKTVWNGVHKTGTWSIDDQGGICWHITGWGMQPCEYYFEGHDGTLWSRFRSLDKIAPDHVVGDLTNAF